MNNQINKIISALFIGNLGSGILSFFIGLYILKISGSALSFGFTQVIGPIVSMMLLPFLGPMIDKYDKKYSLATAQLISILSLICFLFLFNFFEQNAIFWIYLLLIFLKIADLILTTSFAASISELVEKDDVQKVKSMQQLVNATSMILSPIIGGAVFKFFSISAATSMEAILEVVVLLIIIKLNINPIESVTTNDENIFIMFKSGISYILSDKLLFLALFMGMFFNFIFASINIGMPYLQVTVLKFPAIIYSISETCFGIGLITTAIFLLKVKISQPLKFSYKMIGLLSIIMLIFSIALHFITSIPSLLVITANLVFGILITVINIPVSSWMTNYIDSEFQGRVFSILNTGIQILSPLGIILYSVLFDKFNVTSIFFISGIITLIVVLIYPKVMKVSFE